MAMSQEDYMRAYVGDNDSSWKPMPGFFTPGTPLYTEEGGDILKGRRNFEAAKRLLAESGYTGQPITCLVAQDYAPSKAWGEITGDLLKHLGMAVDFVSTDWGTVVARRPKKLPPSQGGWHMFHHSFAGVDGINPATNKWIRANGDDAFRLGQSSGGRS
jgi:peptide/nickel transport system substrate-binding protein